jgi:hypothetical protein
VAVTTRTHVIGSVISTDVTDATLAAAKAGDRDAGASVLANLEDRFRRLARRTAVQAIGDDKVGLRDAYMEDFIQDAHLVAWECLLKCPDETLDGFNAYAYATAERELAAAARDMKNGTNDDPDGKKLFGLLVKHFRELDARHTMEPTDYLTLAENACQDLAFLNSFRGGAYGGRRGSLSADRAYAARLAYQGAISISTPTSDEGGTIADTLAGLSVVDAEADVAQVGYRPIMWTQAVRALEDTVAVPKDADTRQALFLALDRFRAGTVTEEDLDLVEGLPCRNADFGTAVAMLRAVYTQREEGPVESTADKQTDAALGRGSIALNVQRAAQEKAISDVARNTLIRHVVGTLGATQAYVLAATFGIGAMGKFKDDAAIARAMNRAGFANQTATTVYVNRGKARTAFTKKWASIVAESGSEALALELAAAMAEANATKAAKKGITFLADLQTAA